MRKITEDRIVHNAFKRLSKRSSLLACREVPVLGRSADLAYMVKDVIFTVEFNFSFASD